MAHGSPAEPLLESAQRDSVLVLETIAGAAAPAISADPERGSLGANLADYAGNPGGNPAEFENFVAAARRILAGGTTTKRAPDDTAAWLEAAANKILAATRAAETTSGHRAVAPLESRTTLVSLRTRALLARFHARQMIAAVHYNLFKRGLRLAELVAATYAEKEAVAAWRDLVSQCGTHPFAAEWRVELKKLEAGLKELEEQCCPPDEAVLKEKVWEPVGWRAAVSK
jgi:hypothetical protein